MTLDQFLNRAVLTVTDPRAAAQWVLTLPRHGEVLVTGLALVVVLNGVTQGVTTALAPPPAFLPEALTSPWGYMGFFAIFLAVFLPALAAIGRGFGGGADLPQVAVLLIWLQVLQTLAQLALIGLSVLAPGLGALLLFALAVFGLWILIAALDALHGLGSVVKSALVVVLAGLAAIFLASLLLAAMGVAPTGLP